MSGLLEWFVIAPLVERFVIGPSVVVSRRLFLAVAFYSRTSVLSSVAVFQRNGSVDKERLTFKKRFNN